MRVNCIDWSVPGRCARFLRSVVGGECLRCVFRTPTDATPTAPINAEIVPLYTDSDHPGDARAAVCQACDQSIRVRRGDPLHLRSITVRLYTVQCRKCGCASIPLNVRASACPEGRW